MDDRSFNYINKILTFYESELGSGFESGVYHESCSEKMIMQRLERAVKDEACGNLLHSRYAIWAQDLINLIDAAVKALKQQHDEEESLKQLMHASNSIKAYKDVMTVFDGEQQSIIYLFREYASYLLGMDEQRSVIIEKEKIIALLKEYSGVSGADLPRDIDLSVKNKVLRVFVKNAAQNLQNDSAAFEGWVLILKHWLSGEIEYVMLDFEARKDLMHKYGSPESGHYKRFLYRLYCMTRLFPTWFFISDSKSNTILDFVRWLKSSNLLLNHSLKEREDQISTTKTERQIESWFVFHEGKELLSKRWNIDRDKLFNQLPVGVFADSINSDNAVFSRGASAIDIWGIDKDGQTLHLIELKCGDNNGLGVIGETLFYTMLMYDTCIAEEPLFIFGKYKNMKETSDTIAIKNNGENFGHLISHILAENFHPLFNRGVERVIRDGLLNLGIGFDRARYSYLKKDFVDANNDI